MSKRIKGIIAAMSLATVLVGGTASAVPSVMTLQGQLRSGEDPAGSGTYALEIALYSAATGGTELFSETIADVEVADGIFDVIVGGTRPLLSDYFKNNAQVWLQVRMVSGPGVAPEGEAPMPRQQLTTSGYAFAAQHAGTATTATTANTAGYAATAARADLALMADIAELATDVSCVGGCVAINELEFDVATQLELELARVTSVNGLTGGTIGGDVIITGNLTVTGAGKGQISATSLVVSGSVSATGASINGTLAATKLTQAGQDVCDKSGNCAPTTVNNLSGGTLTSGITVNGNVTTANGTVAAKKLTQDGQDVCDKSGNCAPTTIHGLSGGTVSSAVTVNGNISSVGGNISTNSGTVSGANGNFSGTVGANKLTQNGRDVCDASGNCGAGITSINGLTGGNVQGDTTIIGNFTAAGAGKGVITAASLVATGAISGASATLSGQVTASKFIQNGFDVCDKSGNCAPTTIGGLSGGNVTSAVSVSGNVAATGNITTTDGEIAGKTLKQNGNIVCDSSGNCATVTSVNGLSGGTITSGVTVNGNFVSAGNITAGGANGQVVAKVIKQDGNVVCDESGNCGSSVTSVNGLAGGNITSGVTVTGTLGAGAITSTGNFSTSGNITSTGTSGTVAAKVIRQDGNVVCDASGNCGAGITSVNGLTGGTISSAVTISGALASGAFTATGNISTSGNITSTGTTGTVAAKIIRQDGNVVCDTSGNCGAGITSVNGLTGGTISSAVTIGGALASGAFTATGNISTSGNITSTGTTGTVAAKVIKQDGNVVCDESGNCGPNITSVNGLTGGNITSAVTVTGTLGSGAITSTGNITSTSATGEIAAKTLKQNGNVVCDTSGNCGAVTSLNGLSGGTVTSAVVVNGAIGASGNITTSGNITSTGAAGEIAAKTLKQNGNVVCDMSGNCGDVTSVNGMSGGTITSAVTITGALASGAFTATGNISTSGNITSTGTNGTVAAKVIRQDGNVVCDTSGNCGNSITSVNGLSGGAISSAVSVSGNLSSSGNVTAGGGVTAAGNITATGTNSEIGAKTLRQNGNVVCDTSGNCGGGITTINGLSGGNVTSAVSVSGNVISSGNIISTATNGEVSAKVIKQNGNVVCDSSGNCPGGGTGGSTTTVNGLSGGTITSAVTVNGNLNASGQVNGASATIAGTVAATRLTQAGNEVCDESGNCGTSLAQLNCTTNQLVRYGASGWECYTPSAGTTPGEVCHGLGKALQWDGTAWLCQNVIASGLSNGRANGFEVVDDWGWAWDGIQRGNKTWTQAKAVCEAVGARLPTGTDLWRHNTSNGTGNLSDNKADSYLWTLVPYGATADGYIISRLSDGSMTWAAGSENRPFRCVWPDFDSDAFNGDFCHGAPGGACKTFKEVWNTDTMDRAPMPWPSAQWECGFYNGSLMEDHHVQDLIQSNTWANGTYNYLWTADIVDAGVNSFHFPVYRWRDTGDENWVIDDAQVFNGFYDMTYDTWPGFYRFRCMGKKDETIGHLPATPCEDGLCYNLTTGGRRLVADNANRDQAVFSDAAETCRLLGGALPTAMEFSELVRNGWENGSDTWLWVNESNHTNTGATYMPMIGRFIAGSTDIGYRPGERWMPEGANSNGRHTFHYRLENDVNTSFRCVWHETVEQTFRACAANQIQVWTGSAYACQAATNGTTGGSHLPSGDPDPQFVDAWGNAWDKFARTATNYNAAKAACAAFPNARLPTPTELFRVRGNQTMVTPVSNANSAAYLWTSIVNHYESGAQPGIPYQIVGRLSDGSMTHDARTASYAYRCIWPTSKGDVFTGRSCYGEAATPCFTNAANHIRMDRYDRTPLPQASAMSECRFYGGRLASPQDYLVAIHAGLPNASEAWLHTSDANAWAGDGRGYSQVRFRNSGTGGAGTSWAFSNQVYQTGSVTYAHNYQPFRCVFTDELR